ncbi:hypothetical protein TcWFU_009310 [Taenia crassiceps]|uniref:Uncharacterized protein n=1 Tax=Taenia crassiceps TaxID=6207 RepID=A0ABR4QU32_9CEST
MSPPESFPSHSHSLDSSYDPQIVRIVTRVGRATICLNFLLFHLLYVDGIKTEEVKIFSTSFSTLSLVVNNMFSLSSIISSKISV